MTTRGTEQIGFGDGHFIGPFYGNEDYVSSYDDGPPDFEMQATYAGWANGCPVADELIDPETGRGPEVMLNRYAAVNFWFVTITEMALEQENEDVFFQLIRPVSRRIDEPVGKFELISVPPDYEEEIPPMGTLYGWALPRLLIKQIGDSEDQAVTTERLTKGLTALEAAIDVAEDPMELLAWFAEGIAKAGDVPVQEILCGTLSAGWLEEHNALSMINALRGDLQAFAPTIWKAYTDLDLVEREALGIV